MPSNTSASFSPKAASSPASSTASRAQSIRPSARTRPNTASSCNPCRPASSAKTTCISSTPPASTTTASARRSTRHCTTTCTACAWIRTCAAGSTKKCRVRRWHDTGFRGRCRCKISCPDNGNCKLQTPLFADGLVVQASASSPKSPKACRMVAVQESRVKAC